MKIRRLLTGSLAMLLSAAFLHSACAASYWYDYDGNPIAVPDSYAFTGAVSLAGGDGRPASAPQDFFVDQQGRVFVLDSGNGRVLIYDNTLRLTGTIDRFVSAEGEELSLLGPDGTAAQGICVSGDTLYIADTGNSRILVCDLTGQVSQIFTRPPRLEGLEEDVSYRPTKVAVDSVGRVYVIAANVNMGLLQLDSTGGFITYVGAPPVTPDLMTLFWRRFSTEAQLNSMIQYVPTEYSNVAIDGTDFVYGCIRALDPEDLKAAASARDNSGSVSPIRKLNPSGQDILRREGTFPPVGDLDGSSQIVDVALGENGVYTLLDGERGHLFVYDNDGNLLTVFGEKGNGAEAFMTPVAASYLGDRLLVLDAALAQIYVFSPTAYGGQMLDAVELTFTGKFEESYASWEAITEQNPAFSQAYSGVGQSRMLAKDYEGAMMYFKLAGDRTNYSRAFEYARKEKMETIFSIGVPLIAAAAVVVVVLLLLRRMKRYAQGGDEGDAGNP